MFLNRLLCLFVAHEPDRTNVEWKNGRFVGHCKRCGKTIHRISSRNWRAIETDST